MALRNPTSRKRRETWSTLGAEARFLFGGFTRRLSAALPRGCMGLWRSLAVRLTSWPSRSWALSKSSEGWGCGIPCLARGARHWAPAWAEARFLLVALYAALKRRSSTGLQGFVAVGLQQVPRLCKIIRLADDLSLLGMTKLLRGFGANGFVPPSLLVMSGEERPRGLKPGSFLGGFTRRLSAALPRGCTGSWRLACTTEAVAFLVVALSESTEG
jgi:hypothetical protein